MCVSGYITNTTQLIDLSPSFDFLGLGFGKEIRISFPDAIVVGLNVKLRSPCPEDQEQATHPCEIQHPEKNSQIV